MGPRQRRARGAAPLPEEPEELRIELPPVVILPRGRSGGISVLLLLYRDGRPIAWAESALPSPAIAERARALAELLAERALRTRPGEALEGETISFRGRKVVFEGRSQLFVGAEVAEEIDEAALRGRMRAALDSVFAENAGALTGWNGSREGIKGLPDALDLGADDPRP